MTLYLRKAIATLLAACLLASVAAARNVDGFEVEHIVVKGETLRSIAARYEVGSRELKRWNKIRGTRLKPGQRLTVYSQVPVRPRRILEHLVKRGDTPIKIAKKYDTTVKELKRVNGWGRRMRLVPGKAIKVEVEGPENPSVAKGIPQGGRLVNGEKLPDGPGYVVRSGANAYGTNETITLLMTVLPKVKRKWKNAPDVLVGDLSREHGGRFPPHRSHQNGLDVDIGYYHDVRPAPDYFRSATADTIDAEKTWFLLKAFIDTGMVDYIFVDYGLQKPLYEHAKKTGLSARKLEEYFQYPRGMGRTEGLIRHTPSHKNHFHIRFLSRDANS